jgi:type IV pilus assembly protein PilW
MMLRRRQRGLSIVELLVGITIALFVAAAGATLLAGQLQENRRLLVEARLMQDLRTAADIVAHDLRRAGYWGAAANGAWLPGTTATQANPYAAAMPDSAASDAASFRYSRDATENGSVDSNEQFGFRLRNGAVELQLGAGNWQALTDTGALTVTAFTLTPASQDTLLACPKACAASSGTACPPRVRVRSVDIVLAGRAANDLHVQRSVHGQVRLRNDIVVGACPA